MYVLPITVHRRCMVVRAPMQTSVSVSISISDDSHTRRPVEIFPAGPVEIRVRGPMDVPRASWMRDLGPLSNADGEMRTPRNRPAKVISIRQGQSRRHNSFTT